MSLSLLIAHSAQAVDIESTQSASLASEFGCQLDYEYYQPANTAPVQTVLLAHGFMRNLKSMRGWAEHWLSHDIATVVISFCNSTLLNGHHQRNAQDMIAVRKHLKLNGVIYAGFSAGGLAAYLAALEDTAALGYLGLDAVDSGDLASNDERVLDIPALFLLAEPSACNARNNILETVSAHNYAKRDIQNATHCHFEMPYEKRCSWLCGRSSDEQTREIQLDIMRRATDWILATAGALST